MARANRRQARNRERTVSLTRRLRIDIRYLGRNCIIYVTTFLLRSRVDTREANVSATIKSSEEEKTEGDATTWHGAARRGDASFPFRECDCGCSIDARRHYAEARMNRDKRTGRGNGQMFSSSPTCAIPLLFNTDDDATRRADARRTESSGRGKKHCWEKFRQMPFSPGSLHVYLMFNLSQLGGSWLSICPANYTERSVCRR